MKLSITPVEDLRWLYQESDYDLGLRSNGYESSGPPPVIITGPSPTPEQIRAATRVRRVLVALAELEPRHKSAIDLAYDQRNLLNDDDGPAYMSRYGVAAGLVMRVQRDRADAERFAKLAAETAKRRRKRAARVGTEGELAAAIEAETAAKQEYRDEQAATKTAERAAVQLLHDAHQAYKATRVAHKAAAVAEYQRAKDASAYRRQAFLAELLDLPRKERNRAKAVAWLREMGVEA